MSDVPEGYRMSEVGIVPIEWEEKQFNDIVFDFRGGAPLTPNDFKDDGIKVLPKGGVTRGGILVIEKDKMQYCSSQYAENHKTNFVDNTYTIIVLRDLVPSGPNIGLMVKIDSNDNFILAQGVYGFKAKDELVSSHFLIHLSNGTEYRKLMNSIMVGSTQVHITNTTFLKLQIPLPPLPEQQAIASALSDVDALIAALEQLITKKRNIKQGAMQQLLTGEKRLPGFDGEWEVKKLGEIGTCIIGLTYKPENVKESGLLVLRSSNVADGNLKFEDNVYVNIKVPDNLVTKEGDILICVRNGSRDLIGKCATIDKNSEGNTFGAFMSIYRTEYYNYVFHQFRTNLIKKQIQENIGATINQITNKNLNSFEIPLPPLPKQQAIAQILSDMDAEIEALEQKQAKYKAIKQGMMQELLTGKTRLA